MKKFPCEAFGKKSDYSGFDKDTWPNRSHSLHLEQISEFQEACTASQHQKLEQKNGIRYSELLRLPYFEYHVVDPMHNLLLGAGKYVMTLWKESKILKKPQLEEIQEINLGEGSLEQTHIDSLHLLTYRRNCKCDISDIDASEILSIYCHVNVNQSLQMQTLIQSLKYTKNCILV